VSEAALFPEFGSWAAPKIPLTIEYSLDLMEQIRAAAQQGRERLSRGGVEAGGVLFGSRLEKSIRILAWRPIVDRMELAKVLQSAVHDPGLTGLLPLGWFVSHRKVEMTAPDQKIYRQYFPFSCQTTLVLQPAADGSARAGFFVRNAAGKVQAAKSAREFTIQPDAPGSEVAEEQAPEVISQEPRRQWLNYRVWIWIIPALLALSVLGAMLRRSGAPKPPPSFSLRANDVGGSLRLEWDRNADIIREAVCRKLDIKDGGFAVPLQLDAVRLHDGYLTYARTSGDLEVRMTVYWAKGTPVTEVATFVGMPVKPRVTVDESAEVNSERDRLKAEVEQLRESVRKESARNRQLEDTVRILKDRVQVQKLLEPKQ